MQCTTTITMSSVFLELLPFVNFHFGFLYGAYIQKYKSKELEISHDIELTKEKYSAKES